MITLATAHPAKFSVAVERATGHAPPGLMVAVGFVKKLLPPPAKLPFFSLNVRSVLMVQE